MRRRLLIYTLALVPAATAAELAPQTLAAWDQYVQSADAAMQARLQPGREFLWIDEAPERRGQLRKGEILVSAARESNPKKVPSGLIHHWIAAAFFPNARLEDVLTVVRDYEHYKVYYNPSVLDSHAIAETPAADRFSMLLMNKSLLLKTALDSEYTSSYVSVGDHRCYSMATSVQLREVQDYGQPGEHELAPDEGSGFIWRLHNITRYQEADGGVYVEMEAMALSRDIPAMMRWMVDPIVRRTSKGAMVTSMRQTLDAVTSATQVVSSPTPASAGVASQLLKASKGQ
jgi:hypothetical protein